MEKELANEVMEVLIKAGGMPKNQTAEEIIRYIESNGYKTNGGANTIYALSEEQVKMLKDKYNVK